MRPFIDAVLKSIECQNWYAALVAALILPDICGKLENPGAKSQLRYIDWYDRYMTPRYTSDFSWTDAVLTGRPNAGPGLGKIVMLSARDCYALRCSLLHAGTDDITDQNVQETLERFIFVVPGPQQFSAHKNLYDRKRLALEVGRFCADMCAGVERWLLDVANNQAVQARMGTLLSITVLP